MTELAQHHGIKVILCSVLPVSDYPFLHQQNSEPPRGRRPVPRIRMRDSHPDADILKLNAWMKDYAARVNATYLDYSMPLADEKGRLTDAVSDDGLHPNNDYGADCRCRDRESVSVMKEEDQ